MAKSKSNSKSKKPVSKRAPTQVDSAEAEGLVDRVKSAMSAAGFERIGSIAARVALVAAIALVTWGSLLIRDRVLEDERLQVDRWSLDFGEFPDWVTDDIRSEIEALRDSALLGLAPAAEKGPIYRRGLLARVRDELLRNAWIDSVANIGLLFPGIEDGVETHGQVWAELRLRRPVALVAWRPHYYLTDGDARRLGRPYDSAFFEGLRIPAIVDTAELRGEPPESGDLWQSRKVRDGISVAEALEDAKLLAAIEEIDVTNVGGLRRFDPEILLRAPGLPPLAWGRSPIAKGARLAEVDVKIANLRRVLASRSTDYERAVLIRLYTQPLTLEMGGTVQNPVVRQ